MDRFHELEVFVAVAEAGSFAKAGTRLRLSPPSVTRAISAMEERLGVQVFNRTTRSLMITEAGQRYLENARRILSDMDAAEKDAVGEAAVPHGHLSITASVMFGRTHLSPIICGFLGQNPRMSVSLILLDRIANLVEEGIDVAVRIGHLPDSKLIARRLGSVRRVLVACPDYLARRGIPRQPSDLRLHSMIAFTGLMPSREWRYLDGRSGNSVSFAPRFEVNDASAAIAAAEAGDGITLALSYMVADKVREGRVVTVLDEFSPPPVPVSLVYPEARIMAPKLRSFIDFSVPRLHSALDKVAVA